MIKKLPTVFLFLIIFTACKNNMSVENDNSTAVIKDNIADNTTSDNKSIQKNITDETVIDIFTNNNGEIITKIYKINGKKTAENNENTQILQLLLKYNDSKCINWIADALKHYNINDNLADTYIQYNDIYLYEPTVLHIAVICGNTDVIRLLIDYGADIYAEDESGEPVFMLADIINNEEIIEIFTKEYENGF